LRPLVLPPASRPARNVLPVHDGVGCSVLTTYTARSAMHMNVPHMLSACWTRAKTKRVWESMLRAVDRDTWTWCMGNSGAQRSARVHDVLAKGSQCTAEATRLEIGISKSKHDKKSLSLGHPLRTVFDGQSSADDNADLAEIIASLEKCHVDSSLNPEMLVFVIGPHSGPSVARTHRDSYHNFALQVPEHSLVLVLLMLLRFIGMHDSHSCCVCLGRWVAPNFGGCCTQTP
jgi:hypothetical protein